jgi:hypothetical protein
MLIRLTARRVATIKPQMSIVDGTSVVVATEMTTRDMVQALKAIAEAMPQDQWRDTINTIEQEPAL